MYNYIALKKRDWYGKNETERYLLCLKIPKVIFRQLAKAEIMPLFWERIVIGTKYVTATSIEH